MAKKVLLGCSAIVVLLVVGIAVVGTLNWDKIDLGAATGTGNDEHSLSQHLEREFGGQPHVEFVCQYPVVGVAPCVLTDEVGSREVTLTFTNYELPKGVAPEEQARRIAILAFNTSGFARASDKTEVIFEDIDGDGSASVSRKFSFSSDALAAGEAPAHRK